MLKLRRPALDPTLATDLAQRQAIVDRGLVSDDPWIEFKQVESERTAQNKKSVIGTLIAAQHGKCVYCETAGASELDHHWPKGPHKRLNQNRGTPAKMFRWDNLVLACHECNSWSCKGANMKWCSDQRTMLLDPFADGDDPLCHFTIETVAESALALGWIEPRTGLSKVALERAEYTRSRLKLNIREQLLRGRARVLTWFGDLVSLLRQLGPDQETKPGRTIRKIFAELLAPGEPYLGGVRQLLRLNPMLRAELLEKMPELGPVIDAWDLTPDDCAKTVEAELPSS